MSDAPKKDDDSDWGTHIQNPNDVWKNETEREKFDDWLSVWHVIVYIGLFFIGVLGAIWAIYSKK